MKRVVIFLIIIVFLAGAYFLNVYLQKQISPRKSFARLMLYFAVTLAMVFAFTFLMVYIIRQLYPQEIMK